MDELEMIYRDPEFIEIIIELLGEKVEAPTDEVEADEVTERVRRMILLRMRQRHTEHQRVT